MTGQYTKETLILRLQQGDENAFRQMVLNYRGALLRTIVQIVHDADEAEDLLQDTYLKVWQRFHLYTAEQGGLYGWMVRVARNTAIDAIRHRQYIPVIACTEADVVGIATTSGLPMTDGIGVEFLVRQVLKATHWQVVDLAYWQGYTHQEIADHLHLPLGTVKSRIRQSLLQLRPLFGCH